MRVSVSTKTPTDLGDVVSVATDNSRHQVVMSTQIFRSTVVNDVCTVLQRSLKVRTHHRVVNDDESFRFVLVNQIGKHSNVGDLEEGISRRLEEDHGDSTVGIGEVRKERGGIGSGDVMSIDPVVRFEVGEDSVRSTVEIVTGDDLVSWLEELEDYVESAHSRSDGECMLR